jgi:hypothetical protein
MITTSLWTFREFKRGDAHSSQSLHLKSFYFFLDVGVEGILP